MACKICWLLEKAALVAGGSSYIYVSIYTYIYIYILQSPADKKTALTHEDSERQWISHDSCNFQRVTSGYVSGDVHFAYINQKKLSCLSFPRFFLDI